ncbi:hypothetical protein EDB86DRAFT_2744506, partial [Lactarius hatsudake]
QFIEGIAYLHKHGVAHLNLKPRNISSMPGLACMSPHLSIINFRLSDFVESKEILVEGYHGTPSSSAKTVPVKALESGEKYSAILANQWSCGKVLK